MDNDLAKLMTKLLVEEIEKKQEEFNAPPPPPVWDDPHYRFLVHRGGSWSYVVDYPYVSPEWFDENLEGDWRSFDNVYYFEKESDMTLFLLKWS